MSLPYTTLTIVGGESGSNAIKSALPLLPLAYYLAVPGDDGVVALFPETVVGAPNSGDFVAARLSASFLNAVVVLATIDGEDTLRMRFFRNGDPVSEYVTEPGKTIGEDLPPSGADADILSGLFGITDRVHLGELTAVLKATRYDDENGFGEARERHGEIGSLLNLPPCSVGMGYESLARGALPEGIEPEMLEHCAADRGMQDAGIVLRQYELFRAKTGETDGQIAARFLAEVIAWEDDFLNENSPSLGTKEIIHARIGQYSGIAGKLPSDWAVLPISGKEMLEVDLGGILNDRPVENVTLFSLSKEVPVELFFRLCERMPWSIWSHEIRRTVIRSPVSPN